MSNAKKTEEKQDVSKTDESDDSLSLTQLLSRKEVFGQTKRTKISSESTKTSVTQKRKPKAKSTKPTAEDKSCTYTIDSIDGEQSNDVPGVTKLLQRQSYVQYVKDKAKKDSTPQVKATKRAPAEENSKKEESITATIIASKPSASAPTPPPVPPIPKTSISIPKIPLPKPVSSALPPMAPPASEKVTPAVSNAQANATTAEPTSPALQIKANTRKPSPAAQAARPALLRWKPETLARAEAPFLKWLNSMVTVGANTVLYLEPMADPEATPDAPSFFARAALANDSMATKMNGLIFQTQMVRELFKRIASRGWLELSASSEAQSPAYSVLRQIFFAPQNQFMTVVCFPKADKVGAVCVLFSDQSIETKAMRLLQSVSLSAKKAGPKAA